MPRLAPRVAAMVASGLLVAGPAPVTQAAPASGWDALTGDEAAPQPGAQTVPDATWAAHVRRDVELTLRDGTTVVGKIYRDNGGSVTLVRTDQVVQVILKDQVTGLRAVQLAARPDGAPTGTTSAGPAPATDRDAMVEQELRSGELARPYKKGRNMAIAGGIAAGVGVTLLIPGIALLSARGRAAGPVVLTAFGGMGVFFGLSAVGAGLSKRGKTKRKAIEKVGLAPWGTPDGGGLTLRGRF